MGKLAACSPICNVSECTPAAPQVFSTASGVRGSLYQALDLRQIRACKVRQYPYSGKWASDGVNSNSGVILMENFGTMAPPLALSFTKERGNGRYLVVADEEGYVKIFNTDRSMPGMIYSQANLGVIRSARWLAHTNAIFDVCWIKEDTFMLTASGDQTIKVWDVENETEVGVMKGHTGSVKSLSANPTQSDLFVSGSRDGCVSFWDTRIPSAVQGMANEVSHGPVAKVKDAHKGFTARFRRRQGYMRSVTAVLYLKDERVVVSAGANDGVVKYWDTRKLKAPVAQTPPEAPETLTPGTNGNRLHGIAGLSQNPSGTRLIAACVDSKIYMYDVMQPERGALKTFSGHVMDTFYIKAAFSPDGTHVLSGSSNRNAYIWKVDEPETNPTVLEGHMEEVTAVSWCPTDFCKIATCSDDYTVRIWTMKEPKFSPEVRRRIRTSVPHVAAEPKAPVSPCAHLPPPFEFRAQERKASRSDKSSCQDNVQTPGPTVGWKRSHSPNETTPISKTSRILHSSSVGKDLTGPLKVNQESPQPRLATSPSSVLSPPGSISKQRKTILDYFGQRPQSSEACDIHDEAN